jgi:structure-specific endonuclease subunit SLX1
MISSHPYHTWPLHVKLFTDEAVKGWQDATKEVATLPLPLGFICSVELEGVDGKSGNVGSGRQGPIGVKDGDVFRPHTLLAFPHT